ncbi:InlB B-repeat-containing protein [Candidatus Saccharibacteria bacterium]|nr:InlB B-repeat-containing protein [Candidatus Saccharibacteria bacterium]
MLNRIRTSFRNGDTLIEVMFAVGVFGLAAVGAISLMNRGLATAQNTLEVTMARQEIDTQAEVLRFLQNAYITTKATLSENPCSDPQSYRDIWKCITSEEYVYPSDGDHETKWVTKPTGGNDPDFYSRTTVAGKNCDELFRLGGGSTTSFSIPAKSFILNPRRLGSADLDSTDLKKIISKSDTVSTSGTYPRLIYNPNDDDIMSDATVENNVLTTSDSSKELQRAEGIWVTAISSEDGVQCKKPDSSDYEFRPDYYDFHIQTCWDSVAGDIASTIGSTVRLFNPDQVALTSKKNAITFDNVVWTKYDRIQSHMTESSVGGDCTSCDGDTRSTNCTKVEGVYSNEHVITSTNSDNTVDLVFSGYTNGDMDEGLSHVIEGIKHFTIDIEVDASKILAHPGGVFTVTLGPISAEVDPSTGVTLKVNGSTADTINSRNFHLLLEKNETTYKVCVDSTCKTATGGENAEIDYNFKHSGHGCGCISKVYLTGILMTNHDPSTVTSDGDCVRYSTAPPPEPEPQVETRTFTLTMHANGGKFSSGSTTNTVSCTTTEPRCTVTIPNTSPTKEGKVFNGWATTNTAVVPNYQASNVITLTADRTIYAVYADPPSGGEEVGEEEIPSTLDDSSIFVVTTWKNNSDVDSYLVRGNMRIYYSTPSYGNDVTLQDGSIVKQFYLDVDARNTKNYNSASDTNCDPNAAGINCGDGFIEIIAMRDLRPGTYKFYTHDYNKERLSGNSLKVRVYTGYASAGRGQFPRDKTPIVTLDYDSVMRSHSDYKKKGISWYVCTITLQADGKVVVKSQNSTINGHP